MIIRTITQALKNILSFVRSSRFLVGASLNIALAQNITENLKSQTKAVKSAQKKC